MVECRHCGYENKYGGICKNCGKLSQNPPNPTQAIKEMSMKQRIFCFALVAAHFIYALFTIFGGGSAVIKYLSSLPENDSKTKLIFGVGLAALVVCVLLQIIMTICATVGLIRYGKPLTGLQAYWLVLALFSIWAIGGVDYNAFIVLFLVSVVMSLLIIAYRKYEFG